MINLTKKKKRRNKSCKNCHFNCLQSSSCLSSKHWFRVLNGQIHITSSHRYPFTKVQEFKTGTLWILYWTMNHPFSIGIITTMWTTEIISGLLIAKYTRFTTFQKRLKLGMPFLKFQELREKQGSVMETSNRQLSIPHPLCMFTKSQQSTSWKKKT